MTDYPRPTLKELYEEVEFCDAYSTVWLDRETGKFRYYSEHPDFEPPQDFTPQQAKKGPKGRYLRLPNQYDVNDYRIARHFIFGLDNKPAEEELCNVLGRPRPFRKFKAICNNYGILEDWYRFKSNAYRDYMIDWCDEHQVDYIDDQETPCNSNAPKNC